jgi:hypothetical protein
MADNVFALRKVGIKPGMFIVLEQGTGCIYFEDNNCLHHYQFDGGDNKVYCGKLSQSQFETFVLILATVRGLEARSVEDRVPDKIRFQFVEP